MENLQITELELIDRPRLYFLIGLPASGKTTFSEHFLKKGIRVSTDDYIEYLALKANKTYNEVWDNKSYKAAEKNALETLDYAIENYLDIIYDQTNLTKKSRQKKLDRIPVSYYKIGIVLKCNDPKEHLKRLSSREGKTIPYNVISSMKGAFEQPSLDEGFDYLYTLNT